MIRTTLGVAGLVAAAALTFSGAARAEEEDKFSYSFTLGATSDYVFRGISLTNEDPAAQGSVDIGYGNFYAGAWASNVDGGGFEPWELDLYAGWTPSIGQFNFDFGVIGYLYPDADVGGSTNYVEFKAGVSTEIVKSLTGGVVLWYTPDQGSRYAETYSIEGTLGYEFQQVGIFTPTVNGLLGYTEAQNAPGFFLGETDYTYWNAGLALAVENLTLDFRYWDTNINTGVLANDDLADSRFVFSAKVTVP